MTARARDVDVTRHVLRCADLEPELDGLTICHLSDLHLSPGARHADLITEAVLTQQSDLYVITGDLIQGARGMATLLDWYLQVRSRLEPCMAVFGNAEHKRRIPTAKLRDALREAGMHVLMNECLRLPLGQRDLQIVGLDDPHTHHSRAPAAFAGADPGRWTLVLMHSPEGVLELGGRRCDLALAGHTHGGQIVLPGVGWLTDNTHNALGMVAGWYDRSDIERHSGVQQGPAAMYVSRGLGTSGWPVRYRCRPEMAIITLAHGDGPGRPSTSVLRP